MLILNLFFTGVMGHLVSGSVVEMKTCRLDSLLCCTQQQQIFICRLTFLKLF